VTPDHEPQWMHTRDDILFLQWTQTQLRHDAMVKKKTILLPYENTTYNHCILALDMGESVIGLAVCDVQNWTYPFPLESIKGYRKIWRQELHRVCELYRPVGMIVGLPLNIDGSESKNCRVFHDKIRDWMRDYAYQKPVLWKDEFCSSKRIGFELQFHDNNVHNYHYHQALKKKNKETHNRHSLVALHLIQQWLKILNKDNPQMSAPDPTYE
jgi:RNase H-fold protein (predicted Holliday junction resolvase)